MRRLRFGVTLYKHKEGGWTVDLTKMRHKVMRTTDSSSLVFAATSFPLCVQTSRFYGPTIHSLSPLLVPIVEKYYKALSFEFSESGNPYLFSMTSDLDRGVSSSQWTQQVCESPVCDPARSPHAHKHTPPSVQRSRTPYSNLLACLRLRSCFARALSRSCDLTHLWTRSCWIRAQRQ